MTKLYLLVWILFVSSLAKAQWLSLPLTDKNCFSIDFYDAKTGCISNGNGAFLTKDGGVSWTSSQIYPDPSPLQFNDVQMLSRKKIMLNDLVGDQWYSTDQGKTWINFYHYNFPTSLYAADSSKVHLIGQGGIYSRITVPPMGAPTYEQKNNVGATLDLLGVYFSDTSIGYVCGDKGFISKTTNGGNNWSAQNSSSNSALRGVFFLTKNVGWIVGEEETILLTTNGGITWKRTSYISGGTTYRSVRFVSPKQGYLCGDFGTIMKTLDGGNTWKSMQTGTYESLNKISFPDSLHGWCVGNNGTVLYLNEDTSLPKIEAVVPTDTFLCTTGRYGILFTVNKKFNASNVFTAQLSDANGSWSNPQSLGTLPSDTSSIISFLIPPGQVLGSNYRIRISATSPPFTSVQTQSPLSIDIGSPAHVSISSPTPTCEGTPLSFVGTYQGGGSNPLFKWYINELPTSAMGINFSSDSLKQGDQVTFQMYSDALCPVPKNPKASVSAPLVPIPPKPVIHENGFVLTSNASTGNQWYRDKVAIPGATTSQYIVQGTGSYQVASTEQSCSSPLSDPVMTVVTGLEQDPFQKKLVAYPIPCRDVLHFHSVNLASKATIYNVIGQSIWSQNLENVQEGTLQLRSNDIGKGYFILELIDLHGAVQRLSFLKE